MTDLKDAKQQVQALLVRPYHGLGFARHFLLEIIESKIEKARNFLLGHIKVQNPNENVEWPKSWMWTTWDAWDEGLDRREDLDMVYHVGFTRAGLEKLIGTNKEYYIDHLFRSFPAFCRGARYAAAQCTPKHESPTPYAFGNPDQWHDPFKNEKGHLMISVIGKEVEEVDRWTAAFQDQCESSFGLKVISPVMGKPIQGHFRDGRSNYDYNENYFGYRETISQPILKIDDRLPEYPGPQKVPNWTMYLEDCNDAIYNLEPFELNLEGYIYDNGFAKDILKYGGFSAFCLFQMKAKAFNDFLNKIAYATRKPPNYIAAKLMGRWRNGTPLALSPDVEVKLPDEKLNDFNYNPDDMNGVKVPPGSHIRRANPRGSIVAGEVEIHRIMRQVHNYGPSFDEQPDDDVDRGLVGHYTGANLEFQFEFVITQWLNTGAFAGYPDNEKDPMFGARYDEEVGEFPEKHKNSFYSVFEDRGMAVPFKEMPRFVIPKGIMYLFFPSMTALAKLTGALHITFEKNGDLVYIPADQGVPVGGTVLIHNKTLETLTITFKDDSGRPFTKPPSSSADKNQTGIFNVLTHGEGRYIITAEKEGKNTINVSGVKS